MNPATIKYVDFTLALISGSFHSFRPCRSSERRRAAKVFVAAPAEAHFSDGARRSIRLMRLQLKISIPTVQGMQYPQPQQNAPPRDRMAFPTLYTYSPAVSIRKLQGCVFQTKDRQTGYQAEDQAWSIVRIRLTISIAPRAQS